MLQGIDLNQVKQYNASLKQYRDKAANINAQIEFTKKELDTICKELSAELGVEVNESNVEAIYNEQVEKINSTLKSGNTILAKIAEEEQKIASGAIATEQAQTTVPAQTVAPTSTQPTPAQPIPPVSAPAEFTSNAMPGSVFGNGSVQEQQAQGFPQFTGGAMFKLGG